MADGIVTIQDAIGDYLTKLAGPPTTRWGRWEFDPNVLVLRHDLYGYEIDLERCVSMPNLMDWIFQLHKKRWMTNDDRGNLLWALDEILDPQATLCHAEISVGRIHATESLVGYAGAVKRHRPCLDATQRSEG